MARFTPLRAALRPVGRLAGVAAALTLAVAGLSACAASDTDTGAAGQSEQATAAETAAGTEAAGTETSGTDAAAATPAQGDLKAPEEFAALGHADAFPLTIEHALGSTTIEELPQRVVSVDWSNHEAALALGVVPIAMQAATWGDDDANGVLPWVESRLTELGAQTPQLFDETEGYDYEAISDANPDVILAAYSGMTQEQYDQLSKIAPVVAYPEVPWATTWQEMTRTVGTALGLAQEAEELVTELEQTISAQGAEHAGIAGQKSLFTSFDPTDLSSLGFYSTHDPRARFLVDLGLTFAPAVEEASATDPAFWITRSTEQIEPFEDVEVLVMYGDDTSLAAWQADPLLSRIPAVRDGAVVVLPSNAPLAAAANPSPLSITSPQSAEYLALVAQAAAAAS